MSVLYLVIFICDKITVLDTFFAVFLADVSYKNPEFKRLVLTLILTLTITLYFRNNG